MHLLFDRRGKRQSVPSSPRPASPVPAGDLQSFRRLQACAAIACLLLGSAPPSAVAQQQPVAAPSPANAPGSMVDLHPTPRDFRIPRGYWKNPFAPYTPTTVDPAVTTNST